MKSILIKFFIIIIIGSAGTYLYMYKSHSDISSLNASFKGKAQELIKLVKNKPESFNNLIIEVTGKITSSDQNSYTLERFIYCQTGEINKQYNYLNDDIVTIKGRVIGYDDLLEELKLDQCILIKGTK